MEVQLASTPWSSPPDKLDRSEPRVDSVRSSRLGRHRAPLRFDSQLKGFTSSFFRCPDTPRSGLRKGGFLFFSSLLFPSNGYLGFVRSKAWRDPY